MRSDAVRWAALATTSLVAGIGILSYTAAPAHERHDPDHALQQLDLLYLDEPAPARRELGFTPGRPAVLFTCARTCDLPVVAGAQVLRSQDPSVARAYGLLDEDGRVATGYALLDARGQVRYRTFDPGLHRQEIQILVDGLR